VRAVIFRVLAGLIALAFAALLLFGDTSKMSLRQMFGVGAVAVGFGLYSVLGSDLGERLIGVVGGGRDPASQKQLPENDKPA
jgi:hypothetical protein